MLTWGSPVVKMRWNSMSKWRDKNYGKSPFDPDYIEDYDREEDYENYITACEEKYEWERENN